MSVVVSITGSGVGVSSVDRNTIYCGNKMWGKSRLFKCAPLYTRPWKLSHVLKGLKPIVMWWSERVSLLQTSVIEDNTNNSFSCNSSTHSATNALPHSAITTPLFSYKCSPVPIQWDLICNKRMMCQLVLELLHNMLDLSWMHDSKEVEWAILMWLHIN